MVDELDGLNDSDSVVDEPATESGEDKLARLETENKGLRDGNSKLGREFKSYREEQDDRYNELLDKISELSSRPAVTGESDNYYNDFDDPTYEDDDVKRFRKIAREEAKKDREESFAANTKAKDKYVDDYSRTIQKLGINENDAVYESILTELEGLPGYSNNGVSDAERNYEKAERNYYRNMYKSPRATTAFKGTTPSGKVGGSSTIEYKDGSDAEISAALQDEHVQTYMKRRGKDLEFVKKAMANKSPMSGTAKL